VGPRSLKPFPAAPARPSPARRDPNLHPHPPSLSPSLLLLPHAQPQQHLVQRRTRRSRPWRRRRRRPWSRWRRRRRSWSWRRRRHAWPCPADRRCPPSRLGPGSGPARPASPAAAAAGAAPDARPAAAAGPPGTDAHLCALGDRRRPCARRQRRRAQRRDPVHRQALCRLPAPPLAARQHQARLVLRGPGAHAAVPPSGARRPRPGPSPRAPPRSLFAAHRPQTHRR